MSISRLTAKQVLVGKVLHAVQQPHKHAKDDVDDATIDDFKCRGLKERAKSQNALDGRDGRWLPSSLPQFSRRAVCNAAGPDGCHWRRGWVGEEKFCGKRGREGASKMEADLLLLLLTRWGARNNDKCTQVCPTAFVRSSRRRGRYIAFGIQAGR